MAAYLPGPKPLDNGPRAEGTKAWFLLAEIRL